MSDRQAAKPKEISDLEAIYGGPGSQGFGTAVFFSSLKAGDDLENAARNVYRLFVGDLWNRWGEDAWMDPWKKVHVRAPGAKRDIVAELSAIEDAQASLSTPMVLDGGGNATAAHAALSGVFDHPDVTELSVYTLGDGGAMSGLMVAGQRTPGGEATFLVFLGD